ncbi:class I SAM-dependent methyltransferase [Aggregatibacter kilianii]|uniref:class I SAM-dependent methyltransferase n=1 Tax=Aggregatibacter kilianii TaxID=2025884 RepID=UPI000D642EB6|nr:methyltransferase domain-containing protein [Aggregatibacter kilianii]
MTIYDIDFNTLYKQHLIHCNHYNLPPEKWDKKAVKMAENLVGKASRYNKQLLEAMQVQPNESVLDIGCGPGTFAIPLAQQGSPVYALDYSAGMLDVLAGYKQKMQLDNLTLIRRSWAENWDDVPQADIVLASRSTLVDDLDDMIDKLRAKAKKRVYLTSVTQRHFLDEGVFAAIGRDDIGFPTYIYLLNRLYQKGIQANLNFIETESGRFMGETYEDLLNSVEFSLGPLNEKEKEGLAAFYRQKQKRNEPIEHGQRKWALIWWNVE